jgi:hypothetical protein
MILLTFARTINKDILKDWWKSTKNSVIYKYTVEIQITLKGVKTQRNRIHVGLVPFFYMEDKEQMLVSFLKQ